MCLILADIWVNGPMTSIASVILLIGEELQIADRVRIDVDICDSCK